ALTHVYTLSLHAALPICAVERHHQRPAHRCGLQLPGPVLQVHIPAHRAHVQPRRLAMALELDIAAHALELQVRAGELRRDVTARSEEHTSELQSPYDLVC